MKKTAVKVFKVLIILYIAYAILQSVIALVNSQTKGSDIPQNVLEIRQELTQTPRFD